MNPWEDPKIVEAAIKSLMATGGLEVADGAHAVLAAVGPMLVEKPVRWEDVDKSTVVAIDIGGDIFGTLFGQWREIGDERLYGYASVGDVVGSYGGIPPLWFRDSEGWHRVEADR